jgi:hypothetical protein
VAEGFTLLFWFSASVIVRDGTGALRGGAGAVIVVIIIIIVLGDFII